MRIAWTRLKSVIGQSLPIVSQRGVKTLKHVRTMERSCPTGHEFQKFQQIETWKVAPIIWTLDAHLREATNLGVWIFSPLAAHYHLWIINNELYLHENPNWYKWDPMLGYSFAISGPTINCCYTKKKILGQEKLTLNLKSAFNKWNQTHHKPSQFYIIQQSGQF